MQINRGDRIRMTSWNLTSQQVQEQFGKVLAVENEGRTLQVVTDEGAVLTWIVDDNNTDVIGNEHSG